MESLKPGENTRGKDEKLPIFGEESLEIYHITLLRRASTGVVNAPSSSGFGPG